MNFSEITNSVYNYLSFRQLIRSKEIDALIKESFDELVSLDSFRYIYAEYDKLLDFLKKEPYVTFLSGINGYFLVCTTLGAEVDRLIRRYSLTSMVKGLVFDASANAYLEYKADEYEKTFGSELTYRFCPGYQGSSALDLKYIFNELKPEKIGIELLPSGMMTPQKSICGIVGKGKNKAKKCAGCIMLDECAYRKVDKRCYTLEKN